MATTQISNRLAVLINADNAQPNNLCTEPAMSGKESNADFFTCQV